MTHFRRRDFLALAATGALAGCAAPGIVSRGEADPFEGGIGGTGIVGLMTDFGSLVVNGLTVELTGRTLIRTAFGRVDEQAIAIGVPLTVFARRSRGRLVASWIMITYPLVGTARLDRDGNYRVNGVRVVPEPGHLGRVRYGGRVAVSGVWARDRVVASRIDPAPDGADLIGGIVMHGGAGPMTLGGVPLSIPAGSFPPRSGSYQNAIGRYDGEVFRLIRTAGGRFSHGATGLRQLSVEGYLEPVPADPGYRVAGLGHSFAEGLRLDRLSGRRAVYFGPYDGAFRARAAYVVPERFAARRAVLAEGYGKGFDGEVVRTL